MATASRQEHTDMYLGLMDLNCVKGASQMKQAAHAQSQLSGLPPCISQDRACTLNCSLQQPTKPRGYKAVWWGEPRNCLLTQAHPVLSSAA